LHIPLKIKKLNTSYGAILPETVFKYKTVINTDNVVLGHYGTIITQVQKLTGIKIMKKISFFSRKGADVKFFWQIQYCSNNHALSSVAIMS
jgi:hypothetical protein